MRLYLISATPQSNGAVRYNATRDRSAAARAIEAIRSDRARIECERGEYVFELDEAGRLVAYEWPTDGVPRSVTRVELDAMRDAIGTHWIVAAHAGGRRNFRGVNLSGADLRGVDLRGVDLGTADLSGVDLSGADLTGAKLHAAKLRGAKLRGAKLGAILRCADLTWADLTGADLTGADLALAALHGAVGFDPASAPLETGPALTAFGLPLRYNPETRSYTAQHPLHVEVTERLNGHGRQRWIAELGGVDVRAHGYGETAAKAVAALEQEILRRERVKAALASWAAAQ